MLLAATLRAAAAINVHAAAMQRSVHLAPHGAATASPLGETRARNIAHADVHLPPAAGDDDAPLEQQPA